MQKSRPVLAQYTIRSKQEYIFKTNKILEIVGASSHIRDAWNYLFECANSKGIKCIRVDEKNYNHEDTISRFEKKELNIAELFCGGGNETLLFDSRDTFVEVNKAFSLYLLKNCPGMIPMAVCVDITNNYKNDYENLMKEAEIEKNRMNPGQDIFILPFTLMDRNTFKPMTRIESMEGKPVRYSEESFSKHKKGLEERNRDNAIKLLDDMVTEKGKESLLAVVHADGNNMGSKIMEMLRDKTSYDECVNMMRKFTLDTAKAFGEEGLKAIESKKIELSKKVKKQSVVAYRVVIKDGDDMTFICNARYVMEYVKSYINAVQNYSSKWNYSSCAGICVFHSHYPFAKAYQNAEQACDDGAKKMVHKVENGKALNIEEGWVDFHYVHSGIGGDLEGIRETQHTADCMARPWIIAGKNESLFKVENLYRLNDEIKKNKISRSYIKGVGAAREESVETGLRELERVYNHYPDFKKNIRDFFKGETESETDSNILKAFYDLSEMYDLWFAED